MEQESVLILSALASAISSDLAFISQWLGEEDGALMRNQFAKPSKLCPGKGISLHGEKAMYERSPGVAISFFNSIRTSHDPNMWETFVGLTETAFAELYKMAEDKLQKPMDVRHEREDDVNEMRTAPSRAVPDEVMLFIFFHIMRGGNEGGIGLQCAAHLYGLSVGTLSNYIRHVAWSLFAVLKDDPHAEIGWPDATERARQEGLIYGFPSAIGFVDGTKIQTWRPKNEMSQMEKYDGQHKFHCLSVLVWTDVFGLIVRVDISMNGSEHDRGLYNNSSPYRYPHMYFSGDQLVIADKGFQGHGDHITFPCKLNQDQQWEYRAAFDRTIRRQRVSNESSIGIVKNRFRIFLRHFPFEDALFLPMFSVGAHLANYRIRRRGVPPVTHERMLRRLHHYYNGNTSS